MTLPFTTAEFFAVFARYNRAVWPAQILLLGVALWICVGMARDARRRVTLGLLAALWVWMAVAYHLRFFAAVNPAAKGFAVLFLAAAALFAWAALTDRERGPRSAGARRLAGWSLVGYALVLYPLLGLAAGQRYPAIPTFGLPCPTTIFTLGVLLLLSASTSRALFVAPLLWAVVGTSAAVGLEVVEDLGLAAAGLVAAYFLLRRDAEAGRRAPERPRIAA
jgi:hypothetical protein